MPAARLRRHGSMQQLLLELAPPPPPTLENFSAGRNGAALRALREALADGERFVFLWGPGGSGKTHLLRGFSEAAAAAKLEAAAVDDVARLDDVDRYSLQRKRPITLPLLKEALSLLDADSAKR